MKIKLLPSLYAVVAMLILANCVREIDFSQENLDQNTLVVNGTFSDGPGAAYFAAYPPGDYNKQVFEPVAGAQVTLLDNLGNRYDYQEITPSDARFLFYKLEGAQGVAGRTYTLEIRLPDGEIYRSRPAIMPQRVPLDSVTVKGEKFVSTNSNGAIVSEPFAYVYAYSTAPAAADERYLRWESEAVYIFNEIVKFYNPFGVIKQCFITNRLSDQRIAVADLSVYQPGVLISESVGKRKIDYAFEHRICFNVYQRTTDRDAYEYWQKISQLIAPTGTIFDAPPARVYGNVENLSNPDNPALGYFEVAAIDTARVYTQNGGLGDEFLLQDNIYCEYDFEKWPPVNHPECDDCLILPGSTTEIPMWWQ